MNRRRGTFQVAYPERRRVFHLLFYQKRNQTNKGCNKSTHATQSKPTPRTNRHPAMNEDQQAHASPPSRPLEPLLKLVNRLQAGGSGGKPKNQKETGATCSQWAEEERGGQASTPLRPPSPPHPPSQPPCPSLSPPTPLHWLRYGTHHHAVYIAS